MFVNETNGRSRDGTADSTFWEKSDPASYLMSFRNWIARTSVSPMDRPVDYWYLVNADDRDSNSARPDAADHLARAKPT